MMMQRVMIWIKHAEQQGFNLIIGDADPENVWPCSS